MEKLIQLSLNGLMAGAVLAVPAIGLTMIYAVLRFVNFSVAAHMAVGAFAGYTLNVWLGLPAWIAIVGAFIVAGAVGIVIAGAVGYFSARRSVRPLGDALARQLSLEELRIRRRSSYLGRVERRRKQEAHENITAAPRASG